MTPEKWQKLKQIMDALLTKEPQERAVLLKELCGNDEEIKREVESFMKYQSNADSFLEVGPFKVDIKNQFNIQSMIVDEKQLESSSSADFIGTVLDSKYRIEEKLGQGGMGAVYLATHLGTKRKVALKIIVPQYLSNQEFVERFKREAEAAGRLYHPNVVNVTDFGFTRSGHDDIGYLVMEYLDGLTLSQLLNQQGKVSLNFAADIIEQICLALDKAHSLGVIHRDLKPENIWLEPNGRGGFNVKILDFGLAKLHSEDLFITSQNNSHSAYAVTNDSDLFESEAVTINFKPLSSISNAQTEIVAERSLNDEFNLDSKDQLTKIGSILGTPRYMSPEQCNGGMVDYRSDIYSLGIIVYQMLSGETPFNGTISKLIHNHCEDKPVDLRERQSTVPKKIAELVMKSLSKDPDKRPISAIAFSIAFRTNLEGITPILKESIGQYKADLIQTLRLSANIFLPLMILYSLVISMIGLLPAQLLRFSFYLQIILLLPIIIAGQMLNTAAFTIYYNEKDRRKVKPDQVTNLLKQLKKHLAKLLNQILKDQVQIVASPIKFIFSGVKRLANISLSPAITVMEARDNIDISERSIELVEQIRPVIVSLQARNLLLTSITLCIYILTPFLLGVVFDWFKLFMPENRILIAIVTSLLPGIFIIISHPPIALAFSMLYQRSCRICGDSQTAGDTGITTEQSIELLVTRQTNRRSIKVVVLGVLITALMTSLIIFHHTIFVQAVNYGLINTVKALIIVGEDLNSISSIHQHSPLQIAAKNGDVEMVKLLLDNGANIDFNYYGTALHLAANYSQTAVVKVLIERGADVNARDSIGWTPLIFAAFFNKDEIVKLLIDAHADVNLAQYRQNLTPLMAVIFPNVLENESGVYSVKHYESRLKVVKYLIAAGADVNAQTKDGSNALCGAAQKGRLDIMKVLIEAGADVNASLTMPGNALLNLLESRFLSEQDRTEAVRYLISVGANVNVKYIAVGIDVNEKYNNRSALEIAKEKGNPELIELLTSAANKN